jgi:HEAT repeat protein
VYQGRSLSAWLEDASDSIDAADQRQAADAIRAMGTNALPSLIRMLRSKDSQLKLAFLKLAGKQRWIEFHAELASDVHVRAAYGCSILRSEASPAIPALTALLPDMEDNFIVPGALVRIGPDGVMALIGGLTNTDPNVRINIALGLGGIGIARHYATNATPEQIATLDHEADIAVPALLKILGDKTDPAGGQAVVTLGVLGVQADIVVPALISTLQNANSSENELSTAIGAANALGRFGHKAEGAVPALVMALKNPSAGLRAATARALTKIDPEAAAKAGVP